jgi:hypothetical protein
VEGQRREGRLGAQGNWRYLEMKKDEKPVSKHALRVHVSLDVSFILQSGSPAVRIQTIKAPPVTLLILINDRERQGERSSTPARSSLMIHCRFNAISAVTCNERQTLEHVTIPCGEGQIEYQCSPEIERRIGWRNAIIASGRMRRKRRWGHLTRC